MVRQYSYTAGLSTNRKALWEIDRNEPPAPARSRHKHASRLLGGVIAVVGCDGAGKSTLATDLHAALQKHAPTEFLYLGQDSGNILRSILRLPLIGSAIGRYLVRRSQRAHGEKDESASPDMVTAIVVHLLSRWRRRKFRRMLALNRRGIMIVTDRYPQAQVPGFYFDGPGLVAKEDSSALIRWLAAREQLLYEDMARHVPTLLIRLNVDAGTAHTRKPDHKLAMLQDKVRVIPTLSFNGAQIVDLDATAPYAEVLRMALAAMNNIHRQSASFAAPG